MKKTISTIAASALLVTVLFGCGSTTTTNQAVADKAVTPIVSAKTGDASISVTGSDYPLTVRDYLGVETKLDVKPTRVAVLSGAPLNIWYDLGGKSVCTSDVSANVRLTEGYEKEILALPKIGQVYAVNNESIIAQKPDLIIAQSGTQTTAAAALRGMGFKVILTNIRSFDDVLDSYRAFGKILGASGLAEQKIAAFVNERNDIVSKLPNKQVSAVIIYVTAKSIAVKLNNSIAGDIAATLKLKNIASDLPPDTIGSETTPLDIEYIVSHNPDVVFVTTMISSNEEARKTVEGEFRSNPSWSSVKAIAEGKVIYLPQQYYLYNAGPYYVDAIRYMAKSIYPDIYGVNN